MPPTPEFPLYIPSKGRHEYMLTSRALDRMGVPHRLVVEEQEWPAYLAAVDGDRSKLLVLDMAYKGRYELCDEHGLSRSTGSGPARNFIWDHAVSEGHPWHWIMDDNIRAFYRLNHNLKVPVADGTIFRAMEEFCGRYSNVAMAGPNYFMFASRKAKMPPFVANTRIYSCNLIRNDVPFRWRGRYNEDTILSLDMLKAGWCTVLFNAFLQEKTQTMTMKGGNSDELYKGRGRFDMAACLVRQHPDVASVSWKWGRHQHHVDYSRFREQRLIRRPDVDVPDGVDNFGMRLRKVRAATA